MHHTHKKHTKLAWRLFPALLLLFISLSGCDLASDSQSEKQQWYYGQLSERSQCDAFVTVKHLNCGQGIWGGYWLQLDNGDYLQPTANTTHFRAVHEGDRYRICFENGTLPKITKSKILCSNQLPTADPVRITFLEVMPKTAASTAITSQTGTPRFKRALLH
jgi:hypothetical protein